MRMALYAVILALLIFFAPVNGMDVADLQPVQTVAVSIDNEMVVLKTDTDNRGEGESVQQALDNLEDTTPGVIYLDTAEYLLITEDATTQIDELRKYLSPNVKVSLWDGKGAVDLASRFLNVEDDLPELKNFQKIS